MIKHVQVIACLCLLLLTACSQQRFSFRKTIPAGHSSNKYCNSHWLVTKSVATENIASVAVCKEKDIPQTQAVAIINNSFELKKPNITLVKSFKLAQPKIDTTQKNTLVTKSSPPTSATEIESYALLSIIAAVTGLFVFGLLLGIMAMVFGIIALVQIQKNKNKGTLTAWLGILLGFFDIVALMVYISML